MLKFSNVYLELIISEYVMLSRLILFLNRVLLPLLPHKNRFFCFICVFLERNFKPIYYES